MKKIKCFERKIYAGVLVCLLIVVSLSSTSSLTLRFGDDPDTGDQDSHFGVLFTNQSGDDYFLYGHNTTGDDLNLSCNTVDKSPWVLLEGTGSLTLSSAAAGDIVLDSNAKVYMKDDGIQMFYFVVSGTVSSLSGSDTAGDDLNITANTAETYPYLFLNGNGVIDLRSTSDIFFYEQGIQMFKYSLTGTGVSQMSHIYGSDATTQDLTIHANTVDTYPAIEMLGATTISIGAGSGEDIRLRETNELRLMIDGGTDNVAINGVPPSAHADLFLVGDGVLALKEGALPTADTGYGKFFTNSTNNLYFQDGDGNLYSVNLTLIP